MIIRPHYPSLPTNPRNLAVPIKLNQCLRESEGGNGSGSGPWQAVRTADDTSPVRYAHRRARGDNGYEYSPNSGCLTRQCKQVGSGRNREACPGTVTRGTVVTGFYTYSV